MATHFKLRITEQLSQETVETLMSGIGKYLYCYEGGGTTGKAPHMHFYFVTSIDKRNIVTRIKKLPQYTAGNRYYSLKTMTPDDNGCMNYEAYMQKEGNSHFVNYTMDEIVAIEDLQDTIRNEHLNKVKKRRLNQLQEIDIYLKYTYDPKTELWLNELNEIASYEHISTKVIEWYKQDGRKCSDGQVLTLTRTFMLKYSDTEVWNFSQTICERLRR